jgi:hypothetical protein
MPKRVKMHPLTNEHALAMGILINAWAALEDLVAELITRLLANSLTAGFAICSNMDHSRRCDLLRAVSGRLPLAFSSDLKKLLNDMEATYKIRNLVAHSTWTKAEKRSHIKPMQFRARGSMKITGHRKGEPTYTAASLHKTSQDIHRLWMRMYDLIKQLDPPPNNIPFRARDQTESAVSLLSVEKK